MSAASSAKGHSTSPDGTSATDPLRRHERAHYQTTGGSEGVDRVGLQVIFVDCRRDANGFMVS